MSKTRASGVLAAASLLLVCAAPAHAARCQDVFSKIRQAEPLAPFVVGDSVTVPAGEYLGEQGFAVNAVGVPDVRPGARGYEPARRLPDLVVDRARHQRRRERRGARAALELVGPFARLMLVLPKDLGGRPDPDGRLMRAFEQAHPDQVTTLDWPAYSAGHGDWFAPDRLHLTDGDGAHGFAQMISEAVEFAPPEQIEPPPEPQAARAAAARAAPRATPRGAVAPRSAVRWLDRRARRAPARRNALGDPEPAARRPVACAAWRRGSTRSSSRIPGTPRG